jgi:hypothetical protein
MGLAIGRFTKIALPPHPKFIKTTRSSTASPAHSSPPKSQTIFPGDQVRRIFEATFGHRGPSRGTTPEEKLAEGVWPFLQKMATKLTQPLVWPSFMADAWFQVRSEILATPQEALGFPPADVVGILTRELKGLLLTRFSPSFAQDTIRYIRGVEEGFMNAIEFIDGTTALPIPAIREATHPSVGRLIPTAVLREVLLRIGEINSSLPKLLVTQAESVARGMQTHAIFTTDTFEGLAPFRNELKKVGAPAWLFA